MRSHYFLLIVCLSFTFAARNKEKKNDHNSKRTKVTHGLSWVWAEPQPFPPLQYSHIVDLFNWNEKRNNVVQRKPAKQDATPVVNRKENIPENPYEKSEHTSSKDSKQYSLLLTKQIVPSSSDDERTFIREKTVNLLSEDDTVTSESTKRNTPSKGGRHSVINLSGWKHNDRPSIRVLRLHDIDFNQLLKGILHDRKPDAIVKKRKNETIAHYDSSESISIDKEADRDMKSAKSANLAADKSSEQNRAITTLKLSADSNYVKLTIAKPNRTNKITKNMESNAAKKNKKKDHKKRKFRDKTSSLDKNKENSSKSEQIAEKFKEIMFENFETKQNSTSVKEPSENSVYKKTQDENSGLKNSPKIKKENQTVENFTIDEKSQNHMEDEKETPIEINENSRDDSSEKIVHKNFNSDEKINSSVKEEEHQSAPNKELEILVRKNETGIDPASTQNEDVGHSEDDKFAFKQRKTSLKLFGEEEPKKTQAKNEGSTLDFRDKYSTTTNDSLVDEKELNTDVKSLASEKETDTAKNPDSVSHLSREDSESRQTSPETDLPITNANSNISHDSASKDEPEKKSDHEESDSAKAEPEDQNLPNFSTDLHSTRTAAEAGDSSLYSGVARAIQRIKQRQRGEDRLSNVDGIELAYQNPADDDSASLVAASRRSMLQQKYNYTNAESLMNNSTDFFRVYLNSTSSNDTSKSIPMKSLNDLKNSEEIEESATSSMDDKNVRNSTVQKLEDPHSIEKSTGTDIDTESDKKMKNNSKFVNSSEGSNTESRTRNTTEDGFIVSNNEEDQKEKDNVTSLVKTTVFPSNNPTSARKSILYHHHPTHYSTALVERNTIPEPQVVGTDHLNYLYNSPDEGGESTEKKTILYSIPALSELQHYPGTSMGTSDPINSLYNNVQGLDAREKSLVGNVLLTEKKEEERYNGKHRPVPEGSVNNDVVESQHMLLQKIKLRQKQHVAMYMIQRAIRKKKMERLKKLKESLLTLRRLENSRRKQRGLPPTQGIVRGSTSLQLNGRMERLYDHILTSNGFTSDGQPSRGMMDAQNYLQPAIDEQEEHQRSHLSEHHTTNNVARKTKLKTIFNELTPSDNSPMHRPSGRRHRGGRTRDTTGSKRQVDGQMHEIKFKPQIEIPADSKSVQIVHEPYNLQPNVPFDFRSDPTASMTANRHSTLAIDPRGANYDQPAPTNQGMLKEDYYIEQNKTGGFWLDGDEPTFNQSSKQQTQDNQAGDIDGEVLLTKEPTQVTTTTTLRPTTRPKTTRYRSTAVRKTTTPKVNPQSDGESYAERLPQDRLNTSRAIYVQHYLTPAPNSKENKQVEVVEVDAPNYQTHKNKTKSKTKADREKQYVKTATLSFYDSETAFEDNPGIADTVSARLTHNTFNSTSYDDEQERLAVYTPDNVVDDVGGKRGIQSVSSYTLQEMEEDKQRDEVSDEKGRQNKTVVLKKVNINDDDASTDPAVARIEDSISIPVEEFLGKADSRQSSLHDLPPSFFNNNRKYEGQQVDTDSQVNNSEDLSATSDLTATKLAQNAAQNPQNNSNSSGLVLSENMQTESIKQAETTVSTVTMPKKLNFTDEQRNKQILSILSPTQVADVIFPSPKPFMKLRIPWRMGHMGDNNNEGDENNNNNNNRQTDKMPGVRVQPPANVITKLPRPATPSPDDKPYYPSTRPSVNRIFAYPATDNANKPADYAKPSENRLFAFGLSPTESARKEPYYISSKPSEHRVFAFGMRPTESTKNAPYYPSTKPSVNRVFMYPETKPVIEPAQVKSDAPNTSRYPTKIQDDMSNTTQDVIVGENIINIPQTLSIDNNLPSSQAVVLSSTKQNLSTNSVQPKYVLKPLTEIPLQDSNKPSNKSAQNSPASKLISPVSKLISSASPTTPEFNTEMNLDDMYWTDSTEEIENACKEQKGTNLVVNVLAFGDSLTRGYYNKGKNHHPYTMKLQYLLNRMDQKRCFIVDNEGRDGEIAFSEMPKRMEEIFTNTKKKFDWVIILGGTNDIYNKKHAGRHNAKELTQNILSIHNIARHHQARTVAVTIPEVFCESSELCSDMKQTRETLNDNLRHYAFDHKDDVILCDLADVLTRYKSTRDRKLIAQFFEGGLHLRPRGYETMARVIFEALKPILD